MQVVTDMAVASRSAHSHKTVANLLCALSRIGSELGTHSKCPKQLPSRPSSLNALTLYTP